ncbi:Protein MKS1 [Acorus calamus]|uniref:Protein MKS1 n=1 Tax=Acorus calamus TaxID=4465 RepID=A0AAV9C174_ACOCL|nr:Protein MKS1 [Acorus calamus]
MSSSLQRIETLKPCPRRKVELIGHRPSPLHVHNDSHKIGKPKSSTTSTGPIIIYTVSPKVIHTEPSEFMSLVQRLTGVSSSSTSAASDDEAHRVKEGSCSSGEEDIKKKMLRPSSSPISPTLFFHDLSPLFKEESGWRESLPRRPLIVVNDDYYIEKLIHVVRVGQMTCESRAYPKISGLKPGPARIMGCLIWARAPHRVGFWVEYNK